MKQVLILASLLLCLIIDTDIQAQTTQKAAANDKVKTTVSNIKATESTLNWKAYNVTGSHEGDIKIKSGELQFTNGELSGGQFVLDMTTINSTDLEGKMKGKLDGHLKSADFFDAANHEEATLLITKVAPKGTPNEYKVMGNLTIKGITKPVKFYTTIEKGTATADIQIDRTDYNVQYGSSSFLGSLGDKTIYDEFDVSVKLAF